MHDIYVLTTKENASQVYIVKEASYFELDSLSSNSIQVIHHNVLNLIEVDRASIPKWMEYKHYHNINELCDDLQFELEYIDHYSVYIVNGQHCELEFSTMGNIRLFISWMSTRKHISTFFFISSFPYTSGFQQVQARRHDQDL